MTNTVHQIFGSLFEQISSRNTFLLLLLFLSLFFPKLLFTVGQPCGYKSGRWGAPEGWGACFSIAVGGGQWGGFVVGQLFWVIDCCWFHCFCLFLTLKMAPKQFFKKKLNCSPKNDEYMRAGSHYHKSFKRNRFLAGNRRHLAAKVWNLRIPLATPTFFEFILFF